MDELVDQYHVPVLEIPEKPIIDVRDSVRIGIPLREDPDQLDAGVDSQGNPDPNRIAHVYDWFLRDFQNRDMVLVDKLVHSARMPQEQIDALLERAYQVGLNL